MVGHIARLCLLVSIAALALPAGVSAQSQWTASTYDSGTYLFAGASDPGGSLGVGCTAPSPQGRPAIETGSHESHTTTPYGVLIEFADSLFDWPATYRLDSVVLYLDDTGFRLPPVILDELSGTAVRLPMTDPMVQRLYGVGRLVLDTGTGKAYEYQTAGIADALDTVLLYCVNRWVAMGHPLPPGLARYQVQGQTSTQAQAAAPAPQQRFAIPASAPPAADAHVRRRCQGAYQVDQTAIQSADFDRDGHADFVLNWTDVTCLGPIGARPFCSAANCSIDVFLSSKGYAGPTGLLGLGTRIVTLPDGRAGLMLSATPFVCADGFCDRAWVWNGRDMVQLQ